MPRSAATSIACTTLARKAAVEYGFTIPLVPRMEMPPMSPSRALMVCFAISSPWGTLRVTVAPAKPEPASSSRTISVMFRRGTGLTAGAPTGSPSPGLVTTATPAPPRISTPGSRRSSTSATSSAPWVQSGSSPASLMTLHVARGPSRSQRFSGKVTFCPFGRVVSMASTAAPRASTRAAALAAAAAHAPVVNPSR